MIRIDGFHVRGHRFQNSEIFCNINRDLKEADRLNLHFSFQIKKKSWTQRYKLLLMPQQTNKYVHNL